MKMVVDFVSLSSQPKYEEQKILIL